MIGAVFLVLVHGLSGWAFLNWSWPLFWSAIVWWQLTGLVGISVCLHRQLSHRSFDTPAPVLFFHLLMAHLAGQAGPITWVRVHRTHHKYSDQENDPHSPKQGFWHAHLGWILNRRSRKTVTELSLPVVDLENNFLIRQFEFWHWPGISLQFFVLFYLGGVDWVLWLWGFRLAAVLNSAWAVNSIGHIWGYRNFETKDLSKNSKLLAFLTAGEGYHNNHHAQPSSPSVAVKSGEFDFGWLYIRTLLFLGLASSKQAKCAHRTIKMGFEP